MTGQRLSGDRTTCCGEKVIYQDGRGVCPWCQQWVDEEPRGVMHYVVGTGEIYYSDHYYD